MKFFEEKFMEVSENRICYLDTGASEQKEILLCIHGLACASKDFKYIAEYFYPDYRTISISYLGFGNSDKPLSFGYTIHDQAIIINSFIEKLKLKNITLIAHSYGGGIAQAAVSQKPTYYKRLILLSSMGEIVHNIHKKMLPTAYIFYLCMKIPFFYPLFKQLGISFCRANELSEKVVSDRNANYAILKSITNLSFKELAKDAERIKIPTLYISCPKEKMIQKEVRDRMKKRITNFSVIELEGKSHFVLKTHKNEVNSHIAYFLNNLESSSTCRTRSGI